MPLGARAGGRVGGKGVVYRASRRYAATGAAVHPAYASRTRSRRGGAWCPGRCRGVPCPSAPHCRRRLAPPRPWERPEHQRRGGRRALAAASGRRGVRAAGRAGRGVGAPHSRTVVEGSGGGGAADEEVAAAAAAGAEGAAGGERRRGGGWGGAAACFDARDGLMENGGRDAPGGGGGRGRRLGRQATEWGSSAAGWQTGGGTTPCAASWAAMVVGMEAPLGPPALTRPPSPARLQTRTQSPGAPTWR